MMSESLRGTVRETFFVSQLKNDHNVRLSGKGDFTINDDITCDIGGAGKGGDQISGLNNAYIAADGIEIGFAAKVPLYLFGLLY
jgi:hypothetical protein